jgi:hypothetical protein
MTAPALASLSGGISGYFVSTGANALAQRTPGNDFIGPNATTTSTSYTNLADFGPSVSVTTGTQAIVLFRTECHNSTLDALSAASVAVTGATTVAASDAWCVSTNGLGVATANQQNSRSSVHMFTGLTAGINTFTMKYRAGSGTAGFLNRRIFVFPL